MFAAGRRLGLYQISPPFLKAVALKFITFECRQCAALPLQPLAISVQQPCLAPLACCDLLLRANLEIELVVGRGSRNLRAGGTPTERLAGGGLLLARTPLPLFGKPLIHPFAD